MIELNEMVKEIKDLSLELEAKKEAFNEMQDFMFFLKRNLCEHERIVLLSLVECSEDMTGGEFGSIADAHSYQEGMNVHCFNSYLSHDGIREFITGEDNGAYWLNEKVYRLKRVVQHLVEVDEERRNQKLEEHHQRFAGWGA